LRVVLLRHPSFRRVPAAVTEKPDEQGRRRKPQPERSEGTG